jgi:phage recombination protein Bet
MATEQETITRSRLPLLPAIAKAYSIEAPDWRVLVEQVFPSAKSVDAILLALAYCKKRNLDIYKRPVHVVPMWNSALGKMVETVWPGIAEIRTTAMRTRDYAGIDEVVFGPDRTEQFTGTTHKGDKLQKSVTFPEFASITVHRLDRGGVPRAYRAKVFWKETYATIGKTDVPNDMWESRPYGQLEKCVEAAALRKAFPEELGSQYAAEEMEGRTIDVTPTQSLLTPPAAPPAPEGEIESSGAPKVRKPPVVPRTRQRGVDSVPYTEMAAVAEQQRRVIENTPPVDPDEHLENLEHALEVTQNEEDVADVWAEHLAVASELTKADCEKANAMVDRARKRLDIQTDEAVE